MAAPELQDPADELSLYRNPKTKPKAKANIQVFIAFLKKELDAGAAVRRVAAEDITVGDWIKKFADLETNPRTGINASKNRPFSCDTLAHYADYYRLHVKDDPIANLKMAEVEEDDILEYMVRLSASELKDKSGRKMGGTRKFVLVVSFLRTAFNAYHKKYKRQGNAFQYIEKTKGLCLNNMSLAESDKCAGKHQQPQIRNCQLFKTNQYLTKTVHPGMGSLNNPAPGFMPRIPFLFGSLLPPALDVRNKTSEHDDFQCRLSGIPGVKTQMLRARKTIGTFNDNRIKQGFKLGHIVPVGSRYHQCQGHSRAVDQQMPFTSVFFPGQWGFYPPFPAPGALWSCIRHRLTMSMRYLWPHRMPKVRLATGLQKNPRRTNGGSTDTRGWESRIAGAGRSRGYRYAVHKISLQVPCAAVPDDGLLPVFAGILLRGPAYRTGSTAPPRPKTHPLFPMNGIVSCFPLRF
jgi:hypothetical protein